MNIEGFIDIHQVLSLGIYRSVLGSKSSNILLVERDIPEEMSHNLIQVLHVFIAGFGRQAF